MSGGKCEFGLIGLGNMGSNLALNLADKGFSVAVYNRTTEKTDKFMAEQVGERKVSAARSLQELVGLLAKPRPVLLMVSAGKAVDAVIAELTPLLEHEDLIIDGGNSHFTDTDRRSGEVEQSGLRYMGMGISGGETGARYGPSLMPGGHKQAYEGVRNILEKIAAQVNGDPCVTYLGKGSAGHYVKMVHNGIEYAFMELIAESYDLLRRGAGLQPPELHRIYHEWNQGELGSYLMEITSRVFEVRDPDSEHFLVDMILDQARQKGTGKWTSEEALELQEPAPTLDIAVVMRNLSTRGDLRTQLEERLGGASALDMESGSLLPILQDALYAGLILVFSQGMSLLNQASRRYDYGLELHEVCRIWRGGCIIRAKLLERLRNAFSAQPDLESLLLGQDLASDVQARSSSLRTLVGAAAAAGLPVPGFMACLGYLDAMRSSRLPTNLIQAQRDFFGGHTFERVDRQGIFHHEWES